MKRIWIVPTNSRTAWTERLLPGFNPALLPLAGMAWIDYALQWAKTRGFEEAEIIDYRQGGDLRERLPESVGETLQVTYRSVSAPPPRTPAEAGIPEGEDAIWGLELAGLRIHSIGTWHRANMDLLGTGEIGGVKFTLPGYSAEDGVFVGRNVGTEHGFSGTKPLLLQDCSWCARDVRLEGFCAVGRGSFVGPRTRLLRSVIGDYTFVGADLDLVDKIVVGHRVFDAITGAYVDIGERGLAGAMRGRLKTPEWVRRIVAALRGRSRGRTR